MDWSREGLADAGFEGFIPFAILPEATVPSGPGVYVVLLPDDITPNFREASQAGRFKGKDPSVTQPQLAAAWVAGVGVLYIGKANAGVTGRRGLRKRLDEYRRHGAGEPVGHWGGRYIWQLTDSERLLVAWRSTADAKVIELEAELISQFRTDFGVRPFANRKMGRKDPRPRRTH